MTLQDKIDTYIEDFFEYDDSEPIIDLTSPKTFCLAALFGLFCGAMIGVGYHIIFSSLDCSNTIHLTSGFTQVCFPNQWAEHKLTIMIVTLLAGVLTGASPTIIKMINAYREDNDAPH